MSFGNSAQRFDRLDPELHIMRGTTYRPAPSFSQDALVPEMRIQPYKIRRRIINAILELRF